MTYYKNKGAHKVDNNMICSTIWWLKAEIFN